MTFNQALRIFILRTNGCWPFSRLNQIPYWIAIRVFLKTCRDFEEISAVYLRHALARGQWTPGLSDIDLTVIIKNNLSRDAEFSFLASFWQRISRLQKSYPMLGEIEILSPDYLDSWQKFGLEGRGHSEWKLLAGTEIVTQAYRPNPERFKLEAFDYGFWFFLQQVTDLYNRPSASEFLRLQDLSRVQRKIRRCLAQVGVGGSDDLAEDHRAGDVSAAVLAVLRRLEQGLSLLRIQREGVSADGLGGQSHLNPVSIDGLETPAVNQRGFSCWAGQIRSIYLGDRESAFVVLNSCDDTAENRSCIRDLQTHFLRQPRVVLLTENLFAYYLRYLRPYDYGHFVEHATWIFGENCLARIDKPTKAALEHELLKETPLLLMFPQSQDFFQPGVYRPYSFHDLEYTLNRTLALKVYLETGEAKPSISEMLEAFNALHPQQAAQIEGLKERAKNGFPEKDLFLVLKDALDDIRAVLSANDRWEGKMDFTSCAA